MDVLFPPGPQKSLLLGDAPQFKHHPLDYMQQAARTYGDLVHFRFGPSHAYLLTNPRYAHEVLVEHFDQFAGKPNFFLALTSALGHDIRAPKEPLTRRTMRHGVFKSIWLESSVPDIASTSAQTLDAWTGGDPVTMLETLTLRIIAQTLFGDADGKLDETVSRIAHMLSAQPNPQHFQSPLTLPLWVPSAANRQRQHADAQLKHIVHRLINNRPAGLFARLLAAPICEDWAVEEMLALFRAGHQAAAYTLAWAWSLLLQNPASAETLKAEVDSVLGNRLPTADDLPNLAYCEMVFKETLRLHPPVWVISRQAKKETRLGEYYVPTGSTIFVSPYIVHHSPRYFTSPESFLPERFGESFARRGSTFAYMPFGAGTYAENERDYATLIGKLVLATAAQRFSLTETNPASPELSAYPRGLKLQPQRLAV